MSRLIRMILPIRQIEVRAFEKLQKAMKRMAKDQGLPSTGASAA